MERIFAFYFFIFFVIFKLKSKRINAIKQLLYGMVEEKVA